MEIGVDVPSPDFLLHLIFYYSSHSAGSAVFTLDLTFNSSVSKICSLSYILPDISKDR